MAQAQRAVFSRDVFEFLHGLALNNHREWFEANRHHYEECVREPARAFIRAMAPHLARISPQFVASDKKVSGSLIRIHRDTRFSRDKTPYKTNVGIHFRHILGKDVHAPGYYVHISTEENFVACGVWHPDAAALAKIRRHIDTQPAVWKKALRAKKFRERYTREGDSLTRPPRGYDPDHPLIEDLKLKDHVASVDLTVRQVTSPKLVTLVTEHFAAAKGYMRFLCEALGLDF